MAGDKPLIWNPPNTLMGPSHFFRVIPMGGPNEAHDGGDEVEGGGGNPEDPGAGKPDPDDPDITDGEEPIGSLLDVKLINHESDLAKGADANGKSGHLLAVLKRKGGSLTIELADVRTGINPDEPIEFPLPPGGGE